MSDDKRHNDLQNDAEPEVLEISADLIEVVEVDAAAIEVVEDGAPSEATVSVDAATAEMGAAASADDMPNQYGAMVVDQGLAEPDGAEASGPAQGESASGVPPSGLGKEDRPEPIYDELPADLEWPGGEPVIDSEAVLAPGSAVPGLAADIGDYGAPVAGDLEIPGLESLDLSVPEGAPSPPEAPYETASLSAGHTALGIEDSEPESAGANDGDFARPTLDAQPIIDDQSAPNDLAITDDPPETADVMGVEDAYISDEQTAVQDASGRSDESSHLDESSHPDDSSHPDESSHPDGPVFPDELPPDNAPQGLNEETGDLVPAPLAGYEPDVPLAHGDNATLEATLGADFADDFSGTSMTTDEHHEADHGPAVQFVAPDPAVEAAPAAPSAFAPVPDPEPTPAESTTLPPLSEPEPMPAPEPEPEPEEKNDALDNSAWAIQRKKNFRPIVMEHGEKKYLLDKNGIKPLKSLNEYNKFFTYFLDFPESVSVGVTDLHSEIKYVDVMLRKHLEEQGEMSRDDMVHVYFKDRKAKTETNVFYQVFPRPRFNSLMQAYEGYDPGFTIQDSFGFMYGLLKSLGKKQPHVLAMHMPEAILVLAGRGTNVVAARRIMMLGDDENSLVEGLFALQREIEPLKNSLGEEVEHIEWIEPLTRSLKWNAHPAWKTPVKLWPMVELESDDGMFYSSLPTIVDRIRFETSLGPKEERFLRPLETLEKWIWVFLVLLLGAIASTGVYLGQIINEQEELNLSVAQSIKDVRTRMPKLPHFQAKDLKPVLAMADTINLAAYAPTPTQVWNKLATTKPKAVRIDELGVKYRLDGTEINLRGEVELGLAHAQRVYSEYLESLQQAGYKLVSQSIRLDIQGNQFNVTIELPSEQGKRN